MSPVWTNNVLATPAGLEPATSRLEGECSIQLSYGVVETVRKNGSRPNLEILNYSFFSIFSGQSNRLEGECSIQLSYGVIETVRKTVRDRTWKL